MTAPPAPSPQKSLQWRRRLAAPSRASWPRLLLLLLILLFAGLLLDIWSGEASVARLVTPAVVLRVLARHLPLLGAHIPLPSGVPDWADALVWQNRLPRALGGVLVGMLLALAGVAFQSLLMNPLADPYTVGVSSGSALGSMLVVVLGGAGLLGGYLPSLVAFFAGLVTVALVYGMARVGGRVSAQTFLLSGTIVGTFLWSLIPLMLSLGNRAGLDRRSAILSTLLGNLQYVEWRSVLLLLPFGVAGGLLLVASAAELDAMSFGEETAAHLGVDAEAFKRRVIVAGALMTAAAVSVAGIIAFVGFVVPHLARRLVGPGHRALLPVAMTLGGLLLVLADYLSRVWLNGLEIGAITSLFGAPVFAAVLRQRNRLRA